VNNRLLISALVCAATVLAAATPADEAPDFVPQPSRWGPSDQLGNANHLTPEKVREAAALVRTGRVFDLGTVYREGMAAFGKRNYKAWLLTHAALHPFGRERTTLLEEYVTMSTGIGTQLDGFAHAGSDHLFYNAAKSADIVDPAGAKRYGMEVVPPIVTRGVLVDMVACKGRPLEVGEGITTADFEACLGRQGVSIGPGDAPLIHTGWMRWHGLDDEKFMSGAPGVTLALARRLIEIGVVGVGTDQWTTDVMPAGDGFVIPVHVVLLTSGVYLFQNLILAELAAQCAAERRYEVFFSFTHPKLQGTVQGIGQPIAIM
jgi:hypothetical protein